MTRKKSDSFDLDEIVRIGSRLPKIVVARRRGRINRRTASVETRPVPDIRRDQTHHDVFAQLGARLEGTAVVVDFYVTPGLDRSGGGILRMDHDVLFALTALLNGFVGILRIQERMRLR